MSSKESPNEPFSDQPDDAHPAALQADEPADTSPAAGVPAARSEMEASPEAAEPPPDAKSEEKAEPEKKVVAERKIERTRASGMWVGAIVAAVVMIFLLVFILQNLESVDIQLFSFHFSLPLGVALLLAALSAVLMVSIPGAIRIMQLRRQLSRRS